MAETVDMLFLSFDVCFLRCSESDEVFDIHRSSYMLDHISEISLWFHGLSSSVLDLLASSSYSCSSFFDFQRFLSVFPRRLSMACHCSSVHSCSMMFV